MPPPRRSASLTDATVSEPAVDGGSIGGRAPKAACTTSTMAGASARDATATEGSGKVVLTRARLLTARRRPGLVPSGAVRARTATRRACPTGTLATARTLRTAGTTATGGTPGRRVDDRAELRLRDGHARGRTTPGQGLELRRTGRAGQGLGPDGGLVQQAADLAPLVRQDEADHDTGAAGARRTTGAVQVVLGAGRRVDLEDQADVVDVDAAGGDVGGDEDGQLALLERLEDPRPSTLGQAAVQRTGEHARLAQLLGHAVGTALGAHEDDRAALARGDL